ncbi:hypothetical protein AB9M75_08740 [Lactobacillus sp. AN1001]
MSVTASKRFLIESSLPLSVSVEPSFRAKVRVAVF